MKPKLTQVAFTNKHPKARKDLIERVATVFVKELRKELTPQQFEDMRRANARETNPSICHSHDYCDANMVMLEAMRVHGLAAQFDPADEDHSRFWDAAWDFAKSTALGGRSV